jgi:DNA-binding NarL/FixJ family response regulator
VNGFQRSDAGGARSDASVLVVDPDGEHQAFVKAVLEEAGFDVEGVADGDQALAAARRLCPHLVVLEVRMRGMCGYEVCRTLREQFGDSMAIMFMSGDRTDSADRVAGLLLGADDYVGKPVTPDELMARARALVRRVVRRASSTPPDEHAGLTERELEVLRLLADGLDQATIARTLVITPKTVGKHIEHILHKLPARSRAEAVAIAYQRGLHRPSAPAHAS